MNLNSLRIALTFSGCFLGAGFVSGQELMQFFAVYGLKGLAGLVLAMTLLFLFGVLLMRLAYKSGCGECDCLIIRKNNSFLRGFIGLTSVFFLFGIAVIMSAGVGALFEQQWNIPTYISSGVFCIILYILSPGGHERMVNVFSVTVPVLVVFTVAIGIIAYIYFPSANIDLASSGGDNSNPLLGSWWLSAFTFVAYNLFSSIEILAPLGKVIYNKRRMIAGIAIGCILLLIIALSIFFSMYLCPASVSAELPMLYVAGAISPYLSVAYAVLLVLGMLGTAFSSFVGAMHFLYDKFAVIKQHKRIFLIIFVVVVYLFGLFGFGDLIGTVYPIFGYLGIAALICMIEHFLHLKLQSRKNKNDRI